MTNVQQNPNQKTQDDRYSNQSNKQNPQGQDQDKNRKGGMQDAASEIKVQDPRREQDLPRANADKR